MKNIILSTLLAVGLVGSASAQLTPNANDLFLGFETTGSTGATINYVIDLGQAETFKASGSSILNLGTFGSDLKLIYGTSWYNNTGLLWGAVAGFSAATSYNGVDDPINTIYLSAPTTAVGTDAPAWTTRSKNGQGAPVGQAKNFISGIPFANSSYNGTTLRANAVVESKSDPTSWSAIDPNGIPLQAFNSTIEAAFTNPSSASTAVLDLFRLPPPSKGVPLSGTNGPTENIGFFSIDNSGSVSFTPYLQAQNIPEPSTYALFGIGAIGLLIVMRRKKVV